MRNALADEIVKLAANDKRIVVLIGDVGYDVWDDFSRLYPDRYFNCGIAESNMISLAAGLAMRGFRPIIYTFSAFTVARAFEQIRIDLSFQNLPIIIIGLGAGMGYASIGATHYFNEDLALMRSLPNMAVLCPGDPMESRFAIRAALKSTVPVYLRIGRKGEPTAHSENVDFTIGQSLILKDGRDVCILSIGSILQIVLKVADILENCGISVKIVSLMSLKPLDSKLLCDVFMKYSLVVTIEEHSLIGGGGSAVAEWLVDNNDVNGKLLRIGIPDKYIYHTVMQADALDEYGLSPNKIADTIQSSMNKKMHK